MQLWLFAPLVAGLAIVAFGLSLRYRRDLNAARARLASVERHVVSTRWGAVEYAERGVGDPVLVVHGVFQNSVSGLLPFRDVPDRRFIAPSRFVNRQLILWALRTFAPSTTARLVAAVPEGFAMTSEDVRYVDEFIDSLVAARRP